MSEPRPNAPPDQHPAVRDYGLICMGSLTLMVAALVLRRPDPWALLPALLGALGLLFRWRAAPIIVLLAVLLVIWAWWLGTSPGRMLVYALGWVILIVRKFRGPLPRLGIGRGSHDVLPLSDLLLALSVLTYAAAQYRVQGLTRRLFPPPPRRRALAAVEGPEATKKAEELERRSPDGVKGREFVALLAGLAACGVGAAVFWDWLKDRVTDLEIPNFVWQGILALWLLGGAILIAAAALRYLAFRRMSAPEALLYLQDVLWRESRGEQRRLNRWLAWAWLRRRRREEGNAS
jgi:hypothetical protein